MKNSIKTVSYTHLPIQFLKALLPDPASLGPRTKGKTNIGCIFTGKKDGKEKTYYIYNVCDHQECYKEVGSQAISYTTGVPAMCGALILLTGKWTTKGVHTCLLYTSYAKKFEEAGLTALLGSGFDPGVTQAYCAYAKKHEFDTIDTCLLYTSRVNSHRLAADVGQPVLGQRHGDHVHQIAHGVVQALSLIHI